MQDYNNRSNRSFRSHCRDTVSERSPCSLQRLLQEKNLCFVIVKATSDQRIESQCKQLVQEYNICFTTVKPAPGSELPALPEPSSDLAVLPKVRSHPIRAACQRLMMHLPGPTSAALVHAPAK